MIVDPIERIISEALIKTGIKHTHESENKEQCFDFILTISGVAIECKQFPSDRTEAQILKADNLILIQGRIAAHAFANMIRNAI